MGRGMLTTEEIRILKENPYVKEVHGSRIVYSDEFKTRFIQEYFTGKKPTRIFKDAGFDVKILGNKRIERCASRWKEANAAGALGQKYDSNDFYDRNENEITRLYRIIQEQRAEIKKLNEKINKLQEEAACK